MWGGIPLKKLLYVWLWTSVETLKVWIKLLHSIEFPTKPITNQPLNQSLNYWLDANLVHGNVIEKINFL